MTNLHSVPAAPRDYARDEWRFTFTEKELRARDLNNRLLGALYGGFLVAVFMFAFGALGGFR